MLNRLLLLLILMLLVSACNNETETAKKEELRSKLVELTELAGESEINKKDVDNAIGNAASLDLEREEKDWFVRSYLIDITADKDPEIKKVYEDSQLRKQYEDKWQTIAYERYGVQLEEERLIEIIERTINSIQEGELDSEGENGIDMLFYLANSLDYSLEEFFYIFDRYIYEKWTIGESLYPILGDEYQLTDQQEISEKYRMEVIDEIVKNHDDIS